MPQGKIKVKTTMPSNVKGKKVKKLDKQPPKRKVQSKFSDRQSPHVLGFALFNL